MCSTQHIVHLQDEEYQVEDIRGYVTCKYDRKWCLVCVCVCVQVNDSEIELTFLHHSGPSKSFMYPSPPLVGFSLKSACKGGSGNCNVRTYVISGREGKKKVRL
jgi:hypothetical protein